MTITFLGFLAHSKFIHFSMLYILHETFDMICKNPRTSFLAQTYPFRPQRLIALSPSTPMNELTTIIWIGDAPTQQTHEQLTWSLDKFEVIKVMRRNSVRPRVLSGGAGGVHSSLWCVRLRAWRSGTFICIYTGDRARGRWRGCDACNMRARMPLHRALRVEGVALCVCVRCALRRKCCVLCNSTAGRTQCTHIIHTSTLRRYVSRMWADWGWCLSVIRTYTRTHPNKYSICMLMWRAMRIRRISACALRSRSAPQYV